tara:strand:+ start:114 stop:239 length:126 start_codon:yes stop_codon:yes gene_type:complete
MQEVSGSIPLGSTISFSTSSNLLPLPAWGKSHARLRVLRAL